MEMDVARQLMQLCKKYSDIGNQGSEKRKEETDQSNHRESLKIDLLHPLEEEDEHLQPRKRRFKSIDFIYSSTKPLNIIQTSKNRKT